MHREILVILTLATGSLLAATFTPTCGVQVTVTTHKYLPGRLIHVTPMPTCPGNGRAYVRFRSRTGVQPDGPPGHFTLSPGQVLTRRVPVNWWVEARGKGLTWQRQSEEKP